MDLGRTGILSVNNDQSLSIFSSTQEGQVDYAFHYFSHCKWGCSAPLLIPSRANELENPRGLGSI